jgi:hypothetical protein
VSKAYPGRNRQRLFEHLSLSKTRFARTRAPKYELPKHIERYLAALSKLYTMMPAIGREH